MGYSCALGGGVSGFFPSNRMRGRLRTVSRQVEKA
jgi:hypothetical protein